MITFVSILRGINVSGKNPIKMNDLKELFNTLGFSSITTYIQSGNVVFQYNGKNTNDLASKISQKIEDVFGYTIPVLVMESGKFKKIVDENPFLKDDIDTKFLHITFLETAPDLSNLAEIERKKHELEAIKITNQAVYLYCPNGYGRTKLNNNFLESKLKTQATTRNWKTAQALVKLLKT